jgi:ADP-L-glycero-D-manno-heptose 6-epimerase
MIVVTGGAGFIGSALIWRLNQFGHTDIIVVDRLGRGEKWKNLVRLQYHAFMDKNDFIGKLESDYFKNDITAILHLGACSSTTETDADYLITNNYHYSIRIGEWWEKHRECRFIYASSAATYGSGDRGYGDDEAALESLKPLNMYGYSKHLFDLTAKRRAWLEGCVGLKYFNVFGPNEYHKQDMRSVISKAYVPVSTIGKMELFKSHRPDYKDGEQLRDFLYVKDAVDMTLFFLHRKEIGGIFNIGTGIARPWNAVAAAIFTAAAKPVNIEYIPMPETLQPKYQYYTCADLRKLRSAGYTQECRTLETSIGEYVGRYLSAGAYLADFAD